MATTPQVFPEENVPAYTRASSIVMGRQGFLATQMRLIALELYKLRRRTMTKVLFGVGIGAIVIAYGAISVYTLSQESRPASDFTPPQCSQVVIKGKPCLDHQPTQAEMDQYKHDHIASISFFLRLPGSLEAGIGLGVDIFVVLVVILVGANVGGEYSLGTVRLMFTRGPTRLQFLFAKIVTAIVFVVSLLLAMELLGVLLGLVLNPIIGVAGSNTFFSASWLGHAILYLLAGMMSWFVFGMVALFFGTLGRSTAAGIVGALTWLFVEPVLNQIVGAVVSGTSGPFTDFLKTVPDYFIIGNMLALIHNQAHYVLGTGSSSLTDAHALTVLAVYLVIFIGLSCWVTVRRDVTN